MEAYRRAIGYVVHYDIQENKVLLSRADEDNPSFHIRKMEEGIKQEGTTTDVINNVRAMAGIECHHSVWFS